ncbi:hypothetical protein F0562_019084 [Nyssa sinensis]|uniref:Uncharacterized protein n=1 Tax=Nyssa sinensis TaxID=561372 RepID=A0A5J4ZBC3_9ASTE|nr:hypothetical protein F0562_019084 [Nyssa sinensis]
MAASEASCRVDTAEGDSLHVTATRPKCLEWQCRRFPFLLSLPFDNVRPRHPQRILESSRPKSMSQLCLDQMQCPPRRRAHREKSLCSPPSPSPSLISKSGDLNPRRHQFHPIARIRNGFKWSSSAKRKCSSRCRQPA